MLSDQDLINIHNRLVLFGGDSHIKDLLQHIEGQKIAIDFLAANVVTATGKTEQGKFYLPSPNKHGFTETKRKQEAELAWAEHAIGIAKKHQEKFIGKFD